MWKEIFNNPRSDEEQEEIMTEEYKRPRPTPQADDLAPPRAGADRVSSFLDQGTEFEGKLAFQGAVRVNGKFSGEIFSDGILYVGEQGTVNAGIQVDTVIISGEVTGDVTAKSKVELQSSARLRGNIKTEILKIDEGATFEGNCSMRPGEPVRRRSPLPREAEEPADAQNPLELA